MSKDHLMYATVAELTNSQNTASLIKTYHCLDITSEAFECKSHTPSCAENKAYPPV